MAQLRQDYVQFVERNTEVLVLGPENAEAFRAYWKMNNLPFPGIPDPNYEVLKRYGQEVNLFKMGRMPAQLVIDQEGIVRFVHYGKSMSDIPTTEEITGLLDQINRGFDEPVLPESLIHSH